jgi:SOS-response transcriptional repressor LexA
MDKESNTLSENILKCLERSGLTQKGAALKAGLSETAIRDIVVGRSKNPRYDTIKKIADLFGCSAEDLLNNEKLEVGELMSPIAKVRKEKGHTVDSLAKALGVNSGHIVEIEKGHFLPTLDWLERLAGVLDVSPLDLMPNNKMLNEEHLSVLTRTVPLIAMDAVGGNLFEGDIKEWVPTTASIGLNSYALKVGSDSMEPKFPCGCVIIVDPDVEIINASYVIAKVSANDLPVFRQYVEEGGQKLLRAQNRAFPMQDITDANITFYGKIVQSIMDFSASV